MIKNFIKLFFTTIAILFYLSSFSQSLMHYVRESDKEQYKLSIKREFSDTAAVFAFLDNYKNKQISSSYLSAGFDSIITDNSCIKSYFTLGNKLENVDIDITNLPFKYNKRKLISNFNYPDLSQKIVDYYSNKGYLFVKVKFEDVVVKDHEIKAELAIDKGELIKVDSVMIIGNAKIDNNYIERVLELRKNSTLSMDKIKNIDTRIKNISFLEQERSYQLAFSNSKADVLLYLKNKKSSSISGVLGIMPNNQTTGRLMLTGDVDLSLVNVLGKAEYLKFNWKKYELKNQTLSIATSIPYVFKSPLGFSLNFDLEKKDSSYLKTDFVGKILFGNNLETNFGMYYKNSSSFPIGKNSADTVSSTIKKYTTNLFGFSYNYSSTDNIKNPSKGLILNFLLDVGSKKIDETEVAQNRNQIHSNAQLDVSFYVPIVSNLALKLRTNTYYIYSKSIYDNEFIYVGGIKTIRGFDELSLPVTYYTLVNTELRYLFEKNSALFILADYMYFGKKNTFNDIANYAIGIGAGFDLNTNVGIFSIIYALGKQNDNSFNFNNSKIHFGYKNYF